MTPAQVSVYLQIEQSTVRRWLRKGSLRGYKIGREWHVEPYDLQIFLEAHANIPKTGSAILH